MSILRAASILLLRYDQVAEESWQQFLSRDNSPIVDMFQGQLKSKLTCPECCRVSVTFDPFRYVRRSARRRPLDVTGGIVALWMLVPPGR